MWGCRVGADGVGPERDPPVGAEVLHESARTRVTRLFLTGGTVIRKQPLGADAPRRLGHELGMLERLRGVVGVAQLLEAPTLSGLGRVGGRGGHQPGGRCHAAER